MEIHILFAKISWGLLILILWWRPLAQIANNKFLLRKLPYRKQLGIICGLSAILHVIIYLVGNDLLNIYFTQVSFWSFGNLFGWGNLAFLALLIPLLTSNIFSQRILKGRWKTLQKFSYPAFIFTGIHVALAKGEWIAGLVPVMIWAVLWVWADKKLKVSIKN
jgi:sulfoxide reductase heme-binding subunit YedZ